jgi:Acetyltransferase (GNAT) family
MLGSDSISRLATYYKRHGLRGSLARAVLFVRRSLSSSRMVIFYWDLTKGSDPAVSAALPDNVSVERKASREQIEPSDWQQMVNFWNPTLCAQQFSERLQKGASLWLIRANGRLAGYGWSIVGHTLEPYYYPLVADDVYIYDFLVFPECRGQQVVSSAITLVLKDLANRRKERAHFEVAVWNLASLSATGKVGFPRHQIGVARKTSLFGRTFVEWTSLPEVARRSKIQVRDKTIRAA